MRTRRALGLLGSVALAAGLLSACVAAAPGASMADPDPTPTATPPMSSLPAATVRPSGPPKSPTDAGTDWIAGRVTRGGSGPCYGLETDDGTVYALYSTDGTTLTEGSIVRVRTEPLTETVDCGPGTLKRMLEAQKVG